jgi:hypothetical protein
MQTLSFDRSSVRSQPAHLRAAVAHQPVPRPETDLGANVEWEFSEAMRSSRLPAGWFVLPSALLSCLLLFAVFY